jgi:uncharacterized membrane protein (UPF0136 family)
MSHVVAGPWHPLRVTIAIALVVSFVFGAGDQYLGSLSAHPWAADVSLLSAPWLVLPFVAGWTQQDPKRAAWLGLGCTFAGLAGYCLMTLSPIENAHLSLAGVIGFVRSDPPVFIGGLVTGPLFGWLGYRWRTDRAWWAAAAVVGALCLEPLARLPVGRAIRFPSVWVAEVAAGVALAVYFTLRHHSASRAAGTNPLDGR